jgi:segregation and condensation protein B
MTDPTPAPTPTPATPPTPAPAPAPTLAPATPPRDRPGSPDRPDTPDRLDEAGRPATRDPLAAPARPGTPAGPSGSAAVPAQPGRPARPQAPAAGGSAERAEAAARDPDADDDLGPTGGGSDPVARSGADEAEADPDTWPPDEAFDAVELDDRGWTRRNLEAILLVADEPVPAAVLAEVVGSRLSEVEELLVNLAGEYARDGRGFVLRAVAGGWRLYTHPGARIAVEAFLRAGQQSRLTRAALETLAVIAYRQPVTRFQVAAIRGVNVDGVFRTLSSRGLIREVGTDPGPGQAALYGTTPAFLEQLGLNDLDQLPPIKDFLPDGVDLVELQEQP